MSDPARNAPRELGAAVAVRAGGGVVRGFDYGIIALLAILLTYLPAVFGGGEPWSQFPATCLGGLIALAVAVRVVIAPPCFGPAAIPVIAFLALAILQLTPLPRSVVTELSINTAQTKSNLIGDLPDGRESLDPMTLSFYPLAGENDLRVVLLATTVLAAVVVTCRTPGRVNAMLTIIALIGGAVALLALAQDVSGTTKIYWLREVGFPARSATFVNHSHFGQFMNLSMGAALALLLMRPRSIWPAGVIIVGLLTISLSLTRGGVLSIFGAGACTLLVLLSQRNLRRMGAGVGALGVVALIALLYYGFDRVFERMTDPRGVGIRVSLVRDTLEMFRHFPAFGIGLGNFSWVFPGYDRMLSTSIASHVENEYVQSLAEVGLVGFAIVMSFLAIVWMRYVRGIAMGGKTAAAAIGLGYGLLAVMIHSLSDFGQHLPANACLSAAVCGLILNLGAGSEANPSRRGSRSLSVPLAIGLVGLSVWSALGADRSRRADDWWRQAESLAYDLSDVGWDAPAEQFEPLLTAIDASVQAEPRDAHHRYWQGIYHWRASRAALRADESDDANAREEKTIADARRVIQMLNASRRLCPTYSPPYSMLGQIEYFYLGRAIGVTHVHVAARLDPNESATCFTAGQIDAERGKYASAVKWLGRSVALDRAWMSDVIALALDDLSRPELAIETAGQNYSLMMEVASAMQERPAYADRWRPIYIRATDLLEAQCQSPDAPAWDLGFLGSYRAALGEYGKAETYLRRALLLDSSNLNYRLQLSQSLAAQGKFDQAIDEARTAQRQHPDSAEARELVIKLVGPDRSVQ